MDKQYRLIIFDMDGTLADRDSGELLPGVADWFTEHGAKHEFGIATNQGGVGMRRWMEQDGFGSPEDYPTEDDVWKHIDGLVGRLQRTYSVRIHPLVCFAYQSKKGKWSPTPSPKGSFYDSCWQQNWRKPAPGMLLELMSHYNRVASETLMVGDRPEDEQAAANADVDFQWAWEFFGRDKPV
jgi:histidinol phosphatase-like enzyme